MPIGGMEVFDLKSHFAGKDPSPAKKGKATKEGIQSQKGGVQNTVAKKGKRGYGGPKNLKGHGKQGPGSKGDSVWGSKTGVNPTGHDVKGKGAKGGLPTKDMAYAGSGKSTANTLRKGGDSVWGGYSKGK